MKVIFCLAAAFAGELTSAVTLEETNLDACADYFRIVERMGKSVSDQIDN